MNSAQTFRFIVICFGGVAWLAAAGSVGYYWKRWRASGENGNARYMTFRGLGSLIGLSYVEFDLISYFDYPVVTWRAPLALVCFVVILYAITGTYAEEEHF